MFKELEAMSAEVRQVDSIVLDLFRMILAGCVGFARMYMVFIRRADVSQLK